MNEPAQDNSGQIEFWNGASGEKWARNQDRLDHAFTPLTAALLRTAAAAKGEAAIDIGCGCGDTTLRLAQALGGHGRVLAVDVSQPMVDHAKLREGRLAPADRAPIAWTLHDAASYGFAAGGSDVMVSRFGVMFFADPVAAFRNIRTGLRTGARIAMMCWRTIQENPWVTVPRNAVLPLVPAPQPGVPGAPGPFAFADPERVADILNNAGFSNPHAEKCDAEIVVGRGADVEAAIAAGVEFSTQVGPVGALIREAPEVMEPARAAIAEALRPYARESGLALGAACWIYTATIR